jgi:phosphate uptake regulator
METRKLQEVGGGTYTVSIPKSWATDRGLEAGTRVDLYAHSDGSIVVRNHESEGTELEAVRIEVDGSPAETTRAVRAGQTAGFERITVVAPEPFPTETDRAVRSLVRRFVGTEIVSHDDRELTVRSLLDASDVSVTESVVQLQYVALSIHRGATAAVGATPEDDADGVADAEPAGDAYERLVERDAEAQRLCDMVARHFGRALVSLREVDRLETTRSALFERYRTARHLGRVARHGVEVARAAGRLSGDLPAPVRAELGPVAADARGVVEAASDAVLEGADARTANRVLDDCEETRAAVDALDDAVAAAEVMADAPVGDVVVVARTLDALRGTLDRGRELAYLALQGALRDGRA